MDTLINSLIERLLATSVQTALLTVIVWMMCRLVPRLSPASQCWLWWLVALQALLGLVANPVELAWLPQPPAAPPEAMTAIQSITVNSAAASPSPVVQDWTWQSTVMLLWATGTLIFAWFTMREWRRGIAFLKNSSACNDGHLLEALERTTATCGLRVAPALRLSPDMESPMLIGHIRPTLLLPASTSLSDDELDMALIHELTHLRRHDLWWGIIPALARHLFFFHPFAHLAVREYGIAREAACDATVVNSGDLCRQNYGRLLLRLGASPESRAGLAVSSPTFHSLKRRLAMLQSTSFLPRTASIVVAAMAAAGVLPYRLVAAADAPATFNPVATPTEKSPPSSIEVQILPDNEIGNVTKQVQRLQEARTRTDTPEQESAKRGQETNQNPEVEREYRRLVRDYEAQRRQYETLVSRINQSPIAADTAPPGTAATSSLQAQEFLKIQIAGFEKKLREAEAQVADFKREHPGSEQEYKQLLREYEMTENQVEPQTNAQTNIRQAFAMDAVVDDRVNPDGTALDPTTFGRPICRVTRDWVPKLDTTGRESNDLEELRQLAKGCRPLNVFQVDENVVRANRIAELEKLLAELRLRFTEKHPEVIRLRAQLKELQLNTQARVSDSLDIYRIGRGDILQVVVWQNPNLGTELPVRPDGRISTPLVEDVIAVGKTPTQLARDIESVLKEFIRAPKVSVLVKSASRQ